jgi:hypothetical protein
LPRAFGSVASRHRRGPSASASGAATIEKCAADGTEDVTATLAAAAMSCADVRSDWNLCVRDALATDDAGSSD